MDDSLTQIISNPPAFTVPADALWLCDDAQRQTPRIGVVATSVAESLLRVLVPLIVSDPTKQVEPRFLKYLPHHRRKRGHTVNKICKEYIAFAKTYYRKADGSVAQEVSAIDYALRNLRKLFGRLRIADFGPRKLKVVRDGMIEKGWCRKTVNEQVGRIKRMVKWGVENEIVPPHVSHGLEAVGGLRAGRTSARESEPVKPVPESHIEAVLALVSTPIRTMIELQLLTAMRPGEVCMMRACDIDRSTQPWIYKPMHHKTEHHGHERVIFLGPKTQQLLEPFLMNPATTYLFAPTQALEERHARQFAARKTPLSCGNTPGSNRKRNPKRAPGERYLPLLTVVPLPVHAVQPARFPKVSTLFKPSNGDGLTAGTHTSYAIMPPRSCGRSMDWTSRK